MSFTLIANMLEVNKQQKVTEMKLDGSPLTTDEWLENFADRVCDQEIKYATTKLYGPPTYTVIANIDRTDYSDDDVSGYYALSRESMIIYAAMLTSLFKQHNI